MSLFSAFLNYTKYHHSIFNADEALNSLSEEKVRKGKGLTEEDKIVAWEEEGEEQVPPPPQRGRGGVGWGGAGHGKRKGRSRATPPPPLP